MRVQEIWKFIYPQISYSPRALPSGNMILLGESIFIFPSPMIFVLCSDFYPLSNQINLFMVINIWGIIQSYIDMSLHSDTSFWFRVNQ
jgi:hypothetical protein